MPAPTAPYDSLEQVVNAARMRLNDMIASVGGEVLTDTKPFTIVAINAAWRKFQEKLTSLGFLRFKNEVLFENFQTYFGGVDSLPMVKFDWTGYDINTGLGLNALAALPQDFIAPIELRERTSVTGGAGDTGSPLLTMDFVHGALPRIPKNGLGRLWTWMDEAIWLIGTTNPVDLWIRYWSYAPDFVASGSTPPLVTFPNQPVPIMRALDAFSLYLAAEIATPRGDMTAQALLTAADAAATILVGRENPAVLPPAQPIAPAPPA